VQQVHRGDDRVLLIGIERCQLARQTFLRRGAGGIEHGAAARREQQLHLAAILGHSRRVTNCRATNPVTNRDALGCEDPKCSATSDSAAVG
jgi:hypothetical protein